MSYIPVLAFFFLFFIFIVLRQCAKNQGFILNDHSRKKNINKVYLNYKHVVSISSQRISTCSIMVCLLTFHQNVENFVFYLDLL